MNGFLLRPIVLYGKISIIVKKGIFKPMNDNYAEQLIKRRTPVYAYVLTGVLGAVTAVTVFFALTTGVLAVILMFLAGFVTYLSYRNTNVEFEYLFVSGQLSVDKILGKAKRKKAFECSMEEIQIVAPADSYVLNDYKNIAKTLDFSSHMEHAKVYVAIVQEKGEQTKVLLEPGEKMLGYMRQTSPRKIVL